MGENENTAPAEEKKPEPEKKPPEQTHDETTAAEKPELTGVAAIVEAVKGEAANNLVSTDVYGLGGPLLLTRRLRWSPPYVRRRFWWRWPLNVNRFGGLLNRLRWCGCSVGSRGLRRGV